MAELLDLGNHSTPLVSRASRVSIAAGGLAVCSGCAEVEGGGGDASAIIALLVLLALAVVLLLVFAGLAVLMLPRLGIRGGRSDQSPAATRVMNRHQMMWR